MKRHHFVIATALLAITFAAPALAQARRQPGTGPVAAACQAEIARFCPGMQHVNAQGRRGAIRTCLMEWRAELGRSCALALDTTGPGSRRGMGRGMGAGMGAGMGPGRW